MAMECDECAALEAVRYECIKRYVELVEAHKRQNETASSPFTTIIKSAEADLNLAWTCLEDHRKRHYAHETSA
jgi:hypothetical protein